MLWRIRDSETYLLASIHVMDSVPLLSSQAERAYLRSRRIAFEANLNSTPDPSLFFLPAHNRLSERVPPRLFAALRKRWEEVGRLEADLEREQPWHAAMCLQIDLAAERGFSGENGVDRHIWKRAERDGLETVALESINAPFQAFASAPLGEQIRFLSYVVKNPKACQVELDSMISGWRSRQQKPFEQILKQRLSWFPRAFNMLTTQRNQNWLPQLTAMASDGIPTLVVVGALHCVGAFGLPALLVQSGKIVSLC